MTITLHLEAESPDQLIDDVKRMFHLVPAAQSSSSDITTTDLHVQLTQADADAALNVEPAPKKTRAKKGETAEAKAAIVGTAPTEPANAPAFLEPKADATDAEVSLDAMREAMNKLAQAEGKGMPAVAEILKTFKNAEGGVVAKASQVTGPDRAKVVAACEAALKG